MAKRANSEGHIRQRKDGRWEGQFVAGRNPNGTLKRRSVYGATQAEVKTRLRDIAKQMEDGLYIEPTSITVGQWLSTWFDTYFLPNHRASTATVFLENIRTYLLPAFGSEKLQKLRTEQVQHFVNSHSDKAPATVRKMHVVLRSALKQAVENELIPRNPADKVKLPKLEQKEIEFLNEQEQRALLEALPDTDNGRALRFILGTGLRVSELCGLRWRDVQPKHFTVRQVILRTKDFTGEKQTTLTATPPKSKAGQRDIPLTKTTQAILDIQRQEYRINRLRAGSAWEDNDLVFCTPLGTPKDIRNLRRTLATALQKAGLKHRGLHALRHSFATNALRLGMDARTLSAIIGHTKVAFTLQTYVHPDLESKQKIMDIMDEYLR